MTLDEQQQIIEMGRNAEALKQNPALEECMNHTLETLFMQWASSAPDEYTERDQIWATAQALKAFKNTLDAFIESGMIERKYKES